MFNMDEFLINCGVKAKKIPKKDYEKAILVNQKCRQVAWLYHERKIIWAPNLDTQFKEKWNVVSCLIKSGDKAIFSYMSSIVTGKTQDLLLNRYHIYHFHETPIGKSRVDDKNRLFAYLTENTAYIIGEYPHGTEREKPLTFNQTIFKYWPELFETHTGHSDLTEMQLVNINSKNGNVLDIPLADNITGHLKQIGGTSASGNAIEDIICADMLKF